MTKREAAEAIQAAMQEQGLTFADLAAELERPRVWLAAAVLGQHPFGHEEAVARITGISSDPITRIPHPG